MSLVLLENYNPEAGATYSGEEKNQELNTGSENAFMKPRRNSDNFRIFMMLQLM